MKKQIPPLLAGAAIAVSFLPLWSGVPALRAGGEVKESFTAIAEGALLTTLPQWTHASGEVDTWRLTKPSAAAAGVIDAAALGSYHRALTGAEILLPGKGPYAFKLKFRFAESDAWCDVRIDLLESGGVNGCGISLNGGEAEGSADNKIALSESGTFWGDIKYKAVDARWQPNTWYQLEINDLQLSRENAGLVSIYKVGSPQAKIVDSQPISFYGAPSGAGKIDIIAISSIGAERPFQIGDIELTEAKPQTK